MFKRAMIWAGSQMNGFLSNERRPSVCKRWLASRPGRFIIVLVERGRVVMKALNQGRELVVNVEWGPE